MIKELLLAPMVIVIVLSFTLSLTEIAESTGNKALLYANGMDNAMDCAIHGQSINECSPELTNTEFKTNAIEFQELNNDYIDKLRSELENELNNTNSTNSTIIIIY